MSCLKLAVIGTVLLSLVIGYFLHNDNVTPAPQLPETWWNPGNEKSVDKKIRPFKVNFTDQAIEDLIYRLKNMRDSKPSIKNTGWEYGINTTFLHKIIEYWQNEYNFKAREAYLNQYPQFITNIQGLDIHYIHIKPKNPEGKRVLPLLLQHGWPGSVVEFYKILPMLTSPRPDHDFVFEVIAPSLPGFGFSSAPTITGCGAAQMAVVLKNLMLRLGFQKFYTQGGDWGSVITTDIATMFPQHVLGMHSNLCIIVTARTLLKIYLYSFFPSLVMPKEDYELLYPFSRHLSFLIKNAGYFYIQATKPDTLGVGLSDSPAGLAAYILEKFGGSRIYHHMQDYTSILEKFTMDELIDNLMIYWMSNSITTSFRIYAESYTRKYQELKMDSVPIQVPSACAQFPHEIFYVPQFFLKDRYKNLIRTTKMARGGHFAALEEPELLADDVWASIGEFETMRKASLSK